MVTWATPAAITYGTGLSATQLNATASVPGTLVYSPAAGTVLTAGRRTLHVTFTPTDTADYATVVGTQVITVNKAVPVLNWPAPAAIPYGTPLSATQLDATANVPGTFNYIPAAGTVLGGGGHTVHVYFTPTDTTDYTGANTTQVVTISKAVPVITWAAPAPITYGTALSATQLNATASVPGVMTYVPAAGTVLKGGTQTLKVYFAPTDSIDYAGTTATVTADREQGGSGDHLGGSGADHLWNGVVGDAAQRQGKRDGHLCLFAGGGDRAWRGRPHFARDLHAKQHDQLRHRDGDRVADREQGGPGDHLGSSCGDHLWNGVVGDAAQCHGKRSGHLCLCTGGGNRAEGGHANLESVLHADRQDGLHLPDGDPDADGELAIAAGFPATASLRQVPASGGRIAHY